MSNTGGENTPDSLSAFRAALEEIDRHRDAILKAQQYCMQVQRQIGDQLAMGRAGESTVLCLALLCGPAIDGLQAAVDLLTFERQWVQHEEAELAPLAQTTAETNE